MFFRRKSEANPLDWIEDCKKGKPKAQEMLYKHYYGYVMSICLQYSKTQEQAAEILNDSFYKVFTQIGKYEQEFEFKLWLRKITINTAIDYCRKNTKNLFLTEEITPQTQELTQDFTYAFTAEEILQLLNKLSENQRIVFNLYEIEGYTHDEIAEKLNITEAASRTFLSRAKQKLKEIIEKSYSTTA
jgi:RNA polymerase sigma factor (sigma-70 family)